MLGLTRIIFFFFVLTCFISISQSMDQSDCGSDSDETDTCLSRDQFSDGDQKQELNFIKLEDIQQQPSWFSNIYYTVVNAFESFTENLVKEPKAPQMSQRRKSEENNKLKLETLDEMMAAARGIAEEFFAGDDESKELFNNVLKEVKLSEEETKHKKDKDAYEYPPVHRIDPGAVGDVQYVEIDEGVKTKLVTKSVRPPLFEIPNFLSDEDCDYIIEKSTEKGLNKSSMFSSENETETGRRYGSFRESFSSYLKKDDVGEEFLSKLHDRVSKLLKMPKRIIQWSENLAIGMYKPGGHYHAHQDSNEASREVPCCFQKVCKDSDGTNTTFMECCRLCRYVTVLYYLNDVEEGGETAFPFADLSFGEMLKKGDTDWKNLTTNCHSASVVIKPEKGKAIMWYNHPLDSKGYISNVEKRSYHGGCEVIKGTKWIATNWISTPTYSQRFVPSKFRDIN